MLEDPEHILETIKKRELDIEILQLQLKHNLTKKMVESKLIMHGINGHEIKAPQPPNPVDPWNDRQQKRF